MLEAYVVVMLILSAVSLFGFAVYVILWAIERDAYGPSDSDARRFARFAVYCGAAAIMTWTWPLTVPLVFVYIIYRLIKEAFPSGLNKNDLN